MAFDDVTTDAGTVVETPVQFVSAGTQVPDYCIDLRNYDFQIHAFDNQTLPEISIIEDGTMIRVAATDLADVGLYQYEIKACLK